MYRKGKVHGRAARKLADQVATKTSRRRAAPAKAPIWLDLTQEDDDDDPVEETPQSPSTELMEALEALTLRTAKLQKKHRLPFLLRNLRKVFHARCRENDIPTLASESEYGKPALVKVVYRLAGQPEFEGSTDGWDCPLCELYKLETREMLDAHFEWDHAMCDIVWDTSVTNGVSGLLYLQSHVYTTHMHYLCRL